MGEKEKLSHLMKGVAEDAFQLLISKNPSKVAAFSITCKLFEEAQRARLSRSVYHRLTNVAASFSSSTANIPDLRALIKQIVRDEL